MIKNTKCVECGKISRGYVYCKSCEEKHKKSLQPKDNKVK